ncbi:MAG: NarK/NasA family nitrate transporter [Planctomycetes bacterium]|nr:NarK/NasA family nitrate transporter [Planctomycetota bacterium]
MSSVAVPSGPSGNRLQLTLGTGAFAVCFAIFGSVSAMMPLLRQRLELNTLEVSIALAIPVLLGSLGRIPLGILTDRFGGRRVFLAVMACSILPALLMGWVSSYWQLLTCGFFIGIALASFSVGVGFVSGWFPPERQGMALGVYGAGNVGQSLAAFGAPVLAGALGFSWGFWSFATMTGAWLILFLLLARNSPRMAPPKPLNAYLEPLRARMAWILSLFYFLTFGGFVAMAIYLPIFLTEMFALTPTDAGLRTAGFVLLATIMRPIGGWLSDRIGGQKILLCVFPCTAVTALFMACPIMATFTIGALGMAAAIGLGNGAVFKLVPQHFPRAVGSVTGLVGAAGGLGGFFPPLVLGVLRQTTGSFVGGFLLLAMFSLACLVMCRRSYPTPFEQLQRLPARAVQ